VVFLDDNRRGILQKIDKAECDMAIVSEDPTIKLGLSIPLMNDAFQVVCRLDHPLAKRKKAAGAELSKYEMVLLRRGSGIRDTLDRAFEAKSIQLNVVHETSQVLTLLGLVEAGLGITVLPSLLCPDPAHGTAAVIPLQKPSVQRKLGLIFASGREPSPAARLLADVVQRILASASLKMPPGVTMLE